MDIKQKQTIIDATYELMKEEKISELRVSEIAAAANCSVDDIYDNFGDLEHLYYLASVKVLDVYTHQSQEAIGEISDPMELEMTLWENFLPYVFKYIDVFELIFWNTRRSKVQEAIKEYYDLYPESKTGIEFTEMYFSTSLKDRNTTVLKLAAKEGYIKEEDVPVLVSLNTGLLYNMMASYKDIFRTDVIPKIVTDKYLGVLKSLYDHYRLK